MLSEAAKQADQGRVTINDVARRSGVSKVTVSYVLNNRERNIKISDATKERVRIAAQELGYHPNALARSLANQRTDMLALVMQYTKVYTGGSAFITELMRATVKSASQYDFDLMLYTKCRDNIKQEIAGILDGRSDGALLLRDAHDPVAAELARRGFPAVYIFSHANDEVVSSVDCDNIAGGLLATEYLISLGHKRIGHICGVQDGAAAHDRRIGYGVAMENAGLEVKPGWVFAAAYAGEDFSPLAEVMRRIDRPTALFCWADDVAAALAKYLKSELKLGVPEDVSIIGFDSTPFCEHTSPRLTSVRQPFDKIADAAVAMLRKQIQSRKGEVNRVRFEPSLDIRDSCRSL